MSVLKSRSRETINRADGTREERSSLTDDSASHNDGECRHGHADDDDRKEASAYPNPLSFKAVGMVVLAMKRFQGEF